MFAGGPSHVVCAAHRSPRLSSPQSSPAESVPHRRRSGGTFLQNFGSATGSLLDDTTRSQVEPKPRRPRFWVGPLVAGCCFALGYGVTQRVVTLQSNAEEPVPEAFAPVFFPGQSLDGLRARDGGTSADFQVDLIKLEAEKQPEQEAEEAAKKKAEEAERAEKALQATATPLPPTDQQDWTTPVTPAQPAAQPASPVDVPPAPVEPALLPDLAPLPAEPVIEPAAIEAPVAQPAPALPAAPVPPAVDAVFEPVAPPPTQP